MFVGILASVSAPIFQVLVGTSEIVPPEPLPLGGYTARQGRLSVSGGDTLLARTLILRRGAEQVIFMSAELLTIPESLRDAVERRLPAGSRLFLSATHTHCAPDSQMLNSRMTFSIPGIAAFRERWLDWYADRLASSVKAAKPVAALTKIWAEERRVDANRTRRNNPEPDTTQTQVVGFDRHAVPLFFHYSAHPVIYGQDEQHLRSDWPGMVFDRGQVLLGAIGDVSPKADGVEVEAKLRDFRKRLLKPAAYFETTLAEGKVSDFRFVRQDISLDPVTAHPDFAKDNGIGSGLANLIVGKFAPPRASVTAVRIGKLAIIGIPGEPTDELGRTIKSAGKNIGFSVVLVVSHVNGWMGYVLSESDYERGQYEATLSFYGPNQGKKVVEASIIALKELGKSHASR